MSDTLTTGDAVELSVPLKPEFASTVRVVVSSIGADLDFTVDEIDDLRLAVSEVFTILAEDSGSSTSATCVTRVVVEDDDVVCVTMTPEPSSGAVVLDGLASTILSSVVDDHAAVDGGIELRKRAVEARS